MTLLALALLTAAPFALGIASTGVSRAVGHALAFAALVCVLAGALLTHAGQPIVIAGAGIGLDQIGRIELAFLAAYGALVLGYHMLAKRDSALPAILPAVIAAAAAGRVFGPQLLVAASFLLLACLLTSLLMIGELPDWQSSVAGATYLILSALGGMALLFGLVLADLQQLSPGGLVTVPFVIAVLSVGLALLLGVAPLHFWVPTALERAGPASVTLAVGVLGPATVGLLMQALSTLPQLVVDERVNQYLTDGGLFTAAFGALMALAPAPFRRRAGYVLVSDAGFVLAGIATYTRIGMAGALLHLAQRSLVVLVLVAAAAELERARSSEGDGACDASYFWLAALLAVLSLVALPPLSGFAASWAVYQAVSLADWRIALALALASVVCLGALLAGLGRLRPATRWRWRRPRPLESFLLAVAAVTALWGLAPGPYLGAIHTAAGQLPFLKPF